MFLINVLLHKDNYCIQSINFYLIKFGAIHIILKELKVILNENYCLLFSNSEYKIIPIIESNDSINDGVSIVC